ncbi:MAG: hypothetical protein IKZ88_03740 [Neisseriaceae bacterium]|nr:hypothetical protein [Neisseriaceae bacterium]
MPYNALRHCVKTCGFNWIATIFSAKKSRNDTVFVSGSLKNTFCRYIVFCRYGGQGCPPYAAFPKKNSPFGLFCVCG